MPHVSTAPPDLPTPDLDQPADTTMPDMPMVVGDGGPGVHLPTDPGTPGGSRAVRGAILAAVAVVVLVAGVVATSRQGPAVVAVPDPAAATLVTAPSAPAGPLMFRWAVPVATDRTLVGIALVSDQVLVASRRGAFSSPSPGLEVSAHATLDGRRRWVREFTGSDTAVLVGTGADAVLLAGQPADHPPTGDHAFVDRDLVVSLDADGHERWRLPLDGPTTTGLLDVTRRRLVLDDRHGIRDVDLATGAVVHDLPHVRDGDDRRQARRYAAAWVVPVANGWEVRPDDGPTSRFGPGPAPVVTPALVVVADGSSVRAMRHDGSAAWSRDLGSPVAALEAVVAPGTDVDDQHGPFPLPSPPGDPDVVEVTTRTEVAGGDPEEFVHVVDGRGHLRSSAPDEAVPRPRANLNLRITFDGVPWSLCNQSSWQWPPSTCPHDLAVADDRGRIVGTVDDLIGVGSAADTWSRVTQDGILLQDGDEVQLRRWPDLAVVWALPDGAIDSIPTELRIATSTRGVAIGTITAIDAVAWYA